MDFLRDVKAKLEELEEFSKQAQGMMQEPGQKALFQPKGQPQKGLGGRMKAALKQAADQKFHQTQRPPKQEQTRRSRQPVDSQECPVEEWSEAQGAETASGTSSSIFDNLGGRLDEAYLLQEILGPPRCMREWD